MTHPPPVHPARPRDAIEAADGILGTFVDRNAIPGLSIAVVDRTGPVYTAAYGHRDLATTAPATPDTSYLWFSLTKIATATAALQLADEGRVALDAPVADYVPALRRFEPTPTVGQLLNHTAGYANPLPIRWVRPASADAPPPDELLDRVLSKYGQPSHPVGGVARYSNVGYLMLGAVIEAAAGEAFTDYVRRAILQPLDLDHTAFAHTHPELAATGYVSLPRAFTPALKTVLPSGVVGPRVRGYVALNPFYVRGPSYGGLVGNVVDAGRFAAAHLNDGAVGGVRILRADTARHMRDLTATGKRDFGQGWFRSAKHRSSRPPHVEHLGAGGGFYNAMRLYPSLGLGFVVMTNTTKAFDHHQLFSRLVNLFGGDS